MSDLDALTGSPEVTDALLDHANAAASERIERVVIDEHQRGVVLAGWLLTFPEVLAAVLPDLLADAWDEAVASMRYEDGTPVQLVSVVNPYRPETATGRPEPAPGSEPHNTEGA